MNTALTIIGLSMLIFVIVFYLKRANEKRKATKVQEQLKESKHVTEKEKIHKIFKTFQKANKNCIRTITGRIRTYYIYTDYQSYVR